MEEWAQRQTYGLSKHSLSNQAHAVMKRGCANIMRASTWSCLLHCPQSMSAALSPLAVVIFFPSTLTFSFRPLYLDRNHPTPKQPYLSEHLGLHIAASVMYQSLFARTLEGIRNATDADMSIIQQADEILSAAPFQDFEQMDNFLESRLEELLRVDGPQSHLIVCVVGLALVITFFRARRLGAVEESIPDQELADMWEILCEVLESPLFKKVKVGRSHQGFLSLPFCVLTNADGSNDECWRLHVWLPSSPPPDPRLSIHSHKSFAQSWIIAGEAENTNFNITPAADDENATNALYRLDGATNKTLTSGMKEVLSGSVIYNTGKKVIVEEASRQRYHHGQSYVVPGNAFHTTGLGRKTILATIFFFDVSRGFFEEGGVPIGPLDGTEFTQYRNPEGMRSDVLVRIVEVTRR